MGIFKKEIRGYRLGVWIALAALILISLAWVMQIYSLLDWEGAIRVGFQGYSFTGDKTQRAMADVEFEDAGEQIDIDALLARERRDRRMNETGSELRHATLTSRAARCRGCRAPRAPFG